MKQTLTHQRLVTLLTCICLSVATHASGIAQGKVHGIVKDASNAAPFATVTLLTAIDSSLVKGKITDEQGQFVFENLPYGQYLVAVRYVGFQPTYSKMIQVQADHPTQDIGILQLQRNTNQLGEVLVQAQRQVVERSPDRYTLNVEASTFQTDNLLDIFRAMPFVQVQGESVSVNGKGGILILLDKVQMPGATMQSIMATMTGDEIEKIDFITNPSSRYPANISTVISITTKKARTLGLTGSARSTVSQSIRGRGLVGTSLTYRQSKWVSNLNLNYNRSLTHSEHNGYRVPLNVNGPALREYGLFRYNNTIPSVRGMVEYTLSDKHALGIQANYVQTRVDDNTTLSKRIDFAKQLNGTTDSTLVADGREYSTRHVQSYSLYYTGKLDSLGKSVDLIFTYTPIQGNTTNEMLSQNMYGPDGSLLASLRRVRNDNQSRANIMVGQMDWELPFRNNWNVTAGGKMTLSGNRTQPTQDYLQDGRFIRDEAFSFENVFTENILAGYTTLDKQLGKTTLRAGMRAEHATMLVEDKVNKRKPVDRSFTDFFPTLMLSRPITDDLVMTLNYRKTVQRPGFSVLTPYRVYLDDFTIEEGNPELLPQYTHTFSVNGIYKSNLYVELEYRQEQNVFLNLPINQGGVAYWKNRNFDMTSVGGNVNYSYQVTNWWSGSVFGMGALMTSAMQQKDFGDLAIPSSFYHTIGWQNSFSLPRDLKLETGFNYTGPFNYGLAELVGNHYTRIALKGNLLNKQLQYTLAVLDVFRGSVNGGVVNSSNIQTRSVSYDDARRVQLGVVYRFGKQTVKSAATKKLGNEDVVNRAN
ncbi:outer membrane beta-barrel family protein [Pontibacter virosus]|uniref:Outer membrane receptor for ferrienterochelin and colicin n=1 Tax=Pontibacter virosus TaxID=1765052 RepID=A0A2U1AWY9_9BACT|nr:outer membrane beta-barrel family protein [Pontibacter virosus]PVY40930.1 outer membrane receptor for ferrienterochelin and colicin [Pontibacter virosus]